MTTKTKGMRLPLKPRFILQDNKLVSARYKYTSIQKKILYLIFEKMPYMPPNRRVTIHLSQLYDGQINPSIYTRIKEDSKRLRDLAYHFEKDGNWHYVGVIGAVHYFGGKGILEFEVTDSITPYVSDLKENFSVVNISHLMTFKSVYSQRIYEHLSRFRDTGVWSVNVSDLRFMFQLEDKYRSYNMLKKQVILRAQKELAGSDLPFSFREIKTGKMITTIQFRIQSGQTAIAYQDAISEKRQLAITRLTDLKLSARQINHILENVPIGDVLKTIYFIREKGTQVRNPGGYTWKVFTEHYNLK